MYGRAVMGLGEGGRRNTVSRGCFCRVDVTEPFLRSAPASRRSITVTAPTGVALVNNVTHQMQVDPVSEAMETTPEIPAAVPRPASHHLDVYGIPRSQEAAVVTQVFSPYVSSSEEHQLPPQIPQNEQTSTPGSEFQTHARNPSNESASLPQSHDYETVQGILPKQVPQQTSSPAYQPPQGSGSTSNSDGGKTTPLRIGIEFGTLPNVSSSSEGSTSSTNLFAARNEKTEGKPAGTANSPNGNKKSLEKSLRFGFGNR